MNASFGRLRELLGLNKGSTASGCGSNCNACYAAPGTVTPHSYHVLLRLAPPPGASANQTADHWWPEKIDGDPAVTSIVDALKADPRLIGKAKVTAFDYPAGHTQGEPHPETHDVFLFPAGVHLTNVPTAALPSAVADILTHDGDLDPLLSTIPGGPHQILKGPSLIICCHTARDARCGSLGPPLASKLLTLGAQVIISSHVGGHQYAGNVIVYGRDHPASCDWFGGVCEPTAAEFWGALCALDTGEKAVENKVLRKFWRGRTGLTKDQQKELYEACTGVKDIEDMKA